jgi:hypothetical protein
VSKIFICFVRFLALAYAIKPGQSLEQSFLINSTGGDDLHRSCKHICRCRDAAPKEMLWEGSGDGT